MDGRGRPVGTRPGRAGDWVVSVDVEAGQRTSRSSSATALALRLVVAVVSVALLLLYIYQRVAGSFQPGRGLGLVCGIGATLLLLLSMLYGVRRGALGLFARQRLGSAAGWHRLHLWGGALFVVLFLLHSGLRPPSGALTGLLFVLGLWTALSGAFGLALQRWIPRTLASALSVEVLYERIPDLVANLRERAEALIQQAEKPVADLYRLQLAPLMAAPRARWSYHLDITGGLQRHARSIHYLRPLLDAEGQERLGELEELVRIKLEVDAHYSLQRTLRLWLWLHVPPSMVLCMLVAVHIATYFVY